MDIQSRPKLLYPSMVIAAVAVFLLAANRSGLPYPILLVVGGLAIGVLPGMPEVELDPVKRAALLIRLIRSLGHEARYYIPDRLLEGYGPSAEALVALKQAGADLVVTVVFTFHPMVVPL